MAPIIRYIFSQSKKSEKSKKEEKILEFSELPSTVEYVKIVDLASLAVKRSYFELDWTLLRRLAVKFRILESQNFWKLPLSPDGAEDRSTPWGQPLSKMYKSHR